MRELRKIRTVCDHLTKAARLMVGVPDYQTYVEHRKAFHPNEPIMSYREFFWERQNARYACGNGKFKGCC